MIFPDNKNQRTASSDKELPLAPQPQDQAEASTPPAYSPADVNPIPTRQRANNVCIKRLSAGSPNIKGEWLIDSSLQIPSSVLEPLEEGEKFRPNAWFESEYGSIDVTLDLTGNGRVSIIAKTTHGKVNLYLRSRNPGQHIFVDASSSHGSVNIYLPRDFAGPVSHSSSWRSYRFSSALQPFATTITDARSLVGQWAEVGYGSDENKVWRGDEIVAHSTHQNVNFYYIDEAPKPGEGIGGWFGRWMGGGS